MNSQLFFLLNLVLAIAFLAWFLSGRKSGAGRPTRLNIKNDPQSRLSPPSAKPSLPPPANAPAPAPAPPRAASRPVASNVEPFPSSRERSKTLNVLFLYNGHDWDAYEVLGVPAGASLATVTTRYQELVRGADRGKMEFYEAAYNAILKKV